MGRPLNNKYFGPEGGKLKIRYHNGSQVVDGYIVKQIGTVRYVVSSVGDNNTYVVELAKTASAAQALTPGLATIQVTDANNVTSYVTKIMSSTLVTTAGSQTKWSTSGDSTSVTIDTKPKSEIIVNGRLSPGAFSTRGQDSVWFGQIGNKGVNYQIARDNVNGIELGIKIHQYQTLRAGPVTGPDENGVISITVPAEALTLIGGVQRSTWVIDYAVLAGISGVDSHLSDFDISLTVDLDPSANVDNIVSLRQANADWVSGDGLLTKTPDASLLSLGADLNIVDQDSLNVGYAFLNSYRPESIPTNWATQHGEYFVTLTAKKAGVVVAAVKVKVITDPAASWQTV